MEETSLELKEKLRLIAADVLGWRPLNDDEQRGALAWARNTGWTGREQDKPEFWWTQVNTLERLPQVSWWLGEQVLVWAGKQGDCYAIVELGKIPGKISLQLKIRNPILVQTIYATECEPEGLLFSLIDLAATWLLWRKSNKPS